MSDRVGLPPIGPEHDALVREFADAIATAQVQLLRELGIDHEWESVARACMRAVLIARTRQGRDEGDADLVCGPPLSRRERVHLLRDALERLGEL